MYARPNRLRNKSSLVAIGMLTYLFHTLVCLQMLLRPLVWGLFLVIISSGYLG